MYQGRAKAKMVLLHVHDDLNLHILHMLKGTFLLDAAQIMSCACPDEMLYVCSVYSLAWVNQDIGNLYMLKDRLLQLII